jgi:hypothetical protein
VKSIIEGHLCFFVGNGQLDIVKVLKLEKQRIIERQLAAGPVNSLAQVKQAL